jgi:hypothetical protein
MQQITKEIIAKKLRHKSMRSNMHEAESSAIKRLTSEVLDQKKTRD